MIWLAEAFTRPAMMQKLAKVGFQQSYTYYAWRNDRAGLEEYCRELAGPSAAAMRPSFWPTTHDILTPFMQHSGPAAWRMRAVLAATLVPDVRHLRRLRAARARRAPGRGGADRQREVPVQGPPMGRPRARRPTRGRVARAVPHAPERDPARPPGPAPAAQPALPPGRRRRVPGVLQDLAGRRPERHHHRGGQPGPALAAGDDGPPDMPALGLGWSDTVVVHDLFTRRVRGAGASTTSSASASAPSRCTSSTCATSEGRRTARRARAA